jgi:hypothetical protein
MVYRPDRRLLTIHTEVGPNQTKFPFVFTLHSNVQSEKKKQVCDI